jgi:cystathionine beta-lyase/cystathionine gamma-synthase
MEDAHRRATGTRADQFYSRYANPTVRSFEEAIADLEGAEDALAFASGMGAIATVVLALCSSGDHIVAQRQLYAGTLAFLQGPCQRFGIETTLVDGTEPGAFAAAVRPGKTMLVLAETPSNPRLELVDFTELAALRGPITVVDSTMATPLGQQPLTHGVHLSLHSATKGIAGHNDATLGVVAGEKDLIDAIWAYSVLHGATPSPFDALNALRGLRTLAVRTSHQTDSALHLAESLADHPSVLAAIHPGIPSHPQYDLARRQMRHGGTLVALELRGGRPAARQLLDALQLARVATSLGGPETIVCHPATTTHASLTPAEAAATGVTEGLLRISVGLEDPADLLSDFLQALDSIRLG